MPGETVDFGLWVLIPMMADALQLTCKDCCLEGVWSLDEHGADQFCAGSNMLAPIPMSPPEYTLVTILEPFVHEEYPTILRDEVDA